MPVGPVDESVTYDIRVSGDFAGRVNIKSTLQTPTADDDRFFTITTKSNNDGGFLFTAPDSGAETTQEETLRLTGTAGVGKYVGIVQYECEQVETE